ncbi:MAG TPA: rRNA pseudouridine synthase [Candidatus Fournierella merdavium]|uniref:pseudouridine synthase n=1 Tax=Candidatus Allofournierella merdavium TaxID=2838593 RepID=UPI001FA548FE|nr:rRNA pseudouridine synthase [Candidatus Fournierella merdavium]
MALERIQKVMAEQGLCSRRAAEQIILEGRVKVNGHPARLGDKMDVNRDSLMIDGERIRLVKKQEYHYLMLHKPRGFVTTTSDERGRKTVMDLLADYPVRVFPVGRLDKDSEGLLLLTNDGDFANLMMHPSHGVSKLYRVTVHPRADESQVVALSEGVTLEDGTVTQPAVVNVVVDEPGRTVLEMTIKEGKNRQIRRMCEAVGLEVARLRRSAMGAVKLGMLQPGQYRELTKSEVAALRAAAQKGKARARTQASQEAAARRQARAAGKAPARRASPRRQRPERGE